MIKPEQILRGMAYVPGLASGELQSGTSDPGGIALVDLTQALEPITPPAAFIIVGGAPLSHAMIELVARGIPTVVIDREQAGLLTPGVKVSIDGATGVIIINGGENLPPPRIPHPPKSGYPIQLADGTAVWLLASVRNCEQAHQALISGASGIGLVRSEFIASDAPHPPDVSRLTEEFENLCNAAGHLTVTLRLIDIAADKPPRWLSKAPHILSPLGMQGSRLYHHEPVNLVLGAQLTALAELSDRYPIEVLIPFISRRDELLHWLEFIRNTLPDRVPIGAMAETPGAVVDLANWGDLVDFFSVGTNDLIQYFFGADRDEPALSDMLDPYAPALYRLLQQVAADADKYRDEIRLCGVLPRLSGVLAILVGLGYRRFSVDPIWIPYLAESLYSTTIAEAKALASRVCNCKDSQEVVKTLNQTDR
ncbi:MAG: phosphoenolpyruvate-protein phosphotransferase [Chromatiales bacterium]|jgi:phosphoenolpyruvate-protein kinase (PTS system EI component)